VFTREGAVLGLAGPGIKVSGFDDATLRGREAVDREDLVDRRV
jgi:hypothetical protein